MTWQPEKRDKHLHLDDTLRSYLLAHSSKEHEVLSRLREHTLTLPLGPNRITPQETALFLQFIIRISGTKSVLELGTFTGYSALAMALALPESGTVTTVEKDVRFKDIAADYWEKAGVAKKISAFNISADDALQNLSRTDAAFDLIYIDADKRSYERYVESALPLLSQNGIIVLDNTLWSGAVIDAENTDKKVQALKILNENLARRTDLTTLLLLPIGDGVTVLQKQR